MITCDGLAYDCQGQGIYTLMENQMFRIQGNFVDVGNREHAMVSSWAVHGATLTNDIAIQYNPDDEVPVLQFGFGDLSGFEDDIPSEHGCSTWTTMDPVDMGHELNGGRTVEPNLEACRARCDANPDCTMFSWWADGGCHLNNDDAVMLASNPHWPRAVAGTTDSTCGLPDDTPIELAGSDGEEAFHGEINEGCPLLMYVDGELQDLSSLTPGPSSGTVPLYGSYGDAVYAELVNNDQVHVMYKIDDSGEEYAEMELLRTGSGPGELWSCHWNFYVCLPASQEDAFVETTVGLLGTPNGNTADDWMTRDGTSLPVTTHSHDLMWHYCVDNWCVAQGESIMSYHGDTTYEDHSCEGEEVVDYHDDENCILSADQVYLACRDEPLHIRYACEIDCCLGGCDYLPPLITNDDEKEPETNFEYNGDEACVEYELGDTSDMICENVAVVKLLRSNGDEPLPEDADIFYDISFGDNRDTVSFKVNNPFGAAANVFVKHDRQALEGFVAPECEGEELRPVECENNYEVTVACLDYPDVEPFALVSIYYASVAVSPLNEQATIDPCCEPEEYAPAVGIAEYTFEVLCGCPGTATLLD
jgi:hypothetical protein